MRTVVIWFLSWLISSIVCTLLFIGVAYVFHIDLAYMIGISIAGSILGQIGKLIYWLGRRSVYR